MKRVKVIQIFLSALRFKMPFSQIRSPALGLILLTVFLQLFFLIPTAQASVSSWTQTDWSGGSSQTNWSDSTKFESSSNVDTTTSDQVTLSASSDWCSNSDCDSSWKHRKKITFDNTDTNLGTSSENLVDFPVLVKLSTSNFDYSKANNDGSDLRFTDPDGSDLAYEIEEWNQSAESFIWVKVPQVNINSNDDFIYLYYGNSGASDHQQATNVWDDNYKLVWHLNESTGITVSDSTSNTNTGNKVSATEPNPTIDGKIGGAQHFDGINDQITSTPSKAGRTYVTMAGWFNFDSPDNINQVDRYHWFFGWNFDFWLSFRSYTSEPGPGYFFWLRGTTANGSTNNISQFYSIASKLTGWHYVVARYDGTKAQTFLDGNLTNLHNISDTGIRDLRIIFSIGGNTENNSWFDHAIDEVRLTYGVRSDAWIMANYKSQADDFITIATEENYYKSSGTLTSSIFDTEYTSGALWETLTYDATVPADTSLAVKVRSSNSATMTDATDFSSCDPVTNNSDISSNNCVTDADRYLQYQVTFNQNDPSSTPTFKSIAISFSVYDNEGPILSLDSPNNTYTNNERPTFKWKAATDTAGSISSYELTIDNPSTGTDQPSGDFTITDIPISGTADYETNKYRVQYHGFDDSDPDNNYLSVTTKSSSEWSSEQLDGKLKEGLVTWKVKAVDNSDNETTHSKKFWVDRNAPHLNFIQINDIATSSNEFATTDRTPTLYGTITDFLSGGDPNQKQDETGPKIASGPEQIELKVEKKEGSNYRLISINTININQLNYSCDQKKIEDNAQQKCDKYQAFEYTPREELELGSYRITAKGKDQVGNNSGEISLNIDVITIERITTPQEKKIIKQEVKKLPPKEQEVVQEELEITKTAEEVPPSNLEKTTTQIAKTSKNVFNQAGQLGNNLLNSIKQGSTQLANNSPKLVSSIVNGVAQGVSSTTNFVANKTKPVLNSIAANTAKTGSNIANLTQATSSSLASLTQGLIRDTKDGFSKVAFSVGEKTQDISDRTGLAIINFTYNFVSEPTTISKVKAEVLSPTEVKITWETSHPADGKVNWGYADGIYEYEIQTTKKTAEHEFILTDLKPDTNYHYEVTSHNKNYVYDANRQFITPAE